MGSLCRKLTLISLLLLGFMAWRGAVEAASLRLTWTDVSNNEEGFTIERMAADGSFVQIATVGANVTFYSDSNLTSGSTYCYVVRAFNAAGNSDPSNGACATTKESVVAFDPGPLLMESSSSSSTASSPQSSTPLMLVVNPDSGSTRGSVLIGDHVMIGGFIIDGTAPKTVLIRGRGPSMGAAPFFVPGVLTDPFLQLFSESTVIAENNDWQVTDTLCGNSGFACGGAAEITATGLNPCQSNPGQTKTPPGCAQESAILITLPPGAYTAILSGVSGGTGLGLVEVFEVDGGSSPSRLGNISTRSLTQVGDNVMIGGFIVEGAASKTVLIRGRGSSMGGAPFFVPGVLTDPFLQLFSGQTVIAQNNNWQDAPNCPGFSCGGGPQITATGLDPCQPNPGQSASPPDCAQESAIIITLPPGPYTAILSGVGGGTGVGLVEVFEAN